CRAADARSPRNLPAPPPRAERENSEQFLTRGRRGMIIIRGFLTVTTLLAAFSIAATAPAQNRGGTLRTYNPESIASLSMLEEFANAELPIMGMFNNLVMFDQHVAQNSLQSIVPDLATSWSWDEEGTGLTF